MYNADQIVNGLIRYADNEVINNLPTAGKWVLGTGIGIAAARTSEIASAMAENAIIKALGIVDENGMFDIDMLADYMRQSANKYGKMTIQIPLVGRLTFGESDIDALKNYIERC